MKFTTPVIIEPASRKILLTGRGVVVGSCFATHIGGYLERLRLDVISNPFGVLYNPMSVARGFEILAQGRVYTAEDLVFHDSLWHSFDYHGAFSAPSVEDVLVGINRHEPLSNVDYMIVTLGTTWVYRHDGQVVANCHKIPAKEFSRERMTFWQTLEALTQIANIYPNAQKIFTVSPIRHIKDGLIENSLSKATLRSAVGELIENREDCHYFPAYEIMMDELRDYRFYASDMLHPSAQAVEYIIDRFKETFFDKELQTYTQELHPLLSAADHRPLHPNTPQYEKFKTTTSRKLKSFAERYPSADISDIIAKFA